MSDNEDSNKDMPIRKRASLVWQYFEKLSSVRVKCRICQHEQRYMGNTANALRHLKAKHDIDARPVGLTDPENVKRMKALSASGIPFEPAIAAINIKNECSFDEEEDDEEELGNSARQNNTGVKDRVEEQNTKYNRNSQRLSFYDNEPVIDPYVVNNEETLVDFADSKNHYLNNDKDEEDESFIPIPNENQTQFNRKRSSLEDERIKAETEYFREKAGYYRLQKHLTALQAKKVKLELEQMYNK